MKTFNQFISDESKMRTSNCGCKISSIFSVKIGSKGNFLFLSLDTRKNKLFGHIRLTRC